MATRKFWQKPKLHFEEEKHEHRKVTWLELFFDLYFVVVISALTHDLSSALQPDSLLDFVFSFVAVWWVWIGVTYYNERFETEGFENRLFVFLLMIPIAGLALFAHDSLGHSSPGFILSYTMARILITLMWAYAAILNPLFTKIGVIFIIGFSSSIALCIISLFTNYGISVILFITALIIDLVTPLFTIKGSKQLPQFSTSKLPERFGLFIIIVLGEGVVGVVSSIREKDDVNTAIVIYGILGIALIFSLWWIYFDFVGRRVADQTRIWKQYVWAYLHLPLVICYVAIGAALSTTSDIYGGLSVTSKTYLIAFSGLSLMLLGVIELLLKKDPDEPTHPIFSPSLKFASGIVVASLYFWAMNFSAQGIMILILLLFLVNMVYGLYVWFTDDNRSVDSQYESAM